ncbi:PEP-CTERM sorting domain-containing protein [Massilia sp. erpn]|uniref:PEP-CTERM sorting domain-containing protein n=1 Tax=Massilia sp. erpn TaxID=2738142 RepID=UPI002107EC5A|nr:PEP-CTERM sorting domain-containing protein [Massilia sp. erpn]UTY56398.1 PEP-CTERM sorting domain-containing protein [Massilia sp. erpn]
MKTLAFLTCLLLTVPAKAELLSFNFTGTISSLRENDQAVDSSTLNGSLTSLGYTIKGQFSYDTATGLIVYDAPSAKTFDIRYRETGLGNTLSFSIDQNNFRFNTAGNGGSGPTFTYSQYPWQPLQMTAYGNYYDAHAASYFGLDLGSYTGPAISASPSLLAAVAPTSFSHNSFNYVIHDLDKGVLQARGEITSLNLLPVPEPAGYAMLLAGMAGIGLAARRRQDSSGRNGKR